MKKLLSLILVLMLTASLAGQTKIGGTAKVGGTVKVGVVGAGGGSTLDDGLVAFWKLGEAAGNARSDSSPNGHTLSESAATVASGTGKIGNAAVLNETNHLFRTDNAGLSITTSMTIVGWVSTSASQAADLPGIVSKWESGERSYLLLYNRLTNRFGFSVSSDGTASVSVTASTFGGPTAGTLYFVMAYVDLAADTIGISVNDGAVDTAAYTPAGIFDSAASLEIGRLATSGNVYFGTIDAVGIWSPKLTTTQVTCLHNGGSGQEPPFAACP